MRVRNGTHTHTHHIRVRIISLVLARPSFMVCRRTRVRGYPDMTTRRARYARGAANLTERRSHTSYTTHTHTHIRSHATVGGTDSTIGGRRWRPSIHLSLFHSLSSVAGFIQKIMYFPLHRRRNVVLMVHCGGGETRRMLANAGGASHQFTTQRRLISDILFIHTKHIHTHTHMHTHARTRTTHMHSLTRIILTAEVLRCNPSGRCCIRERSSM